MYASWWFLYNVFLDVWVDLLTLWGAWQDHELPVVFLALIRAKENDRYAPKAFEEILQRGGRLIARGPQGNDTVFLAFLSYLAWSHLDRYEHEETPQDLDSAISYLTTFMKHQTSSYLPNYPVLGRLASSLLARFKHTGDQTDLDQAIASSRESVAVCPFSDPVRATCLDILGDGLHARFEITGNKEDFESALSAHQQALSLRPSPHPRRHTTLIHIAGLHVTRFRMQGDAEYLDRAVLLYREALGLPEVDEPTCAMTLTALGNALVARALQRSDPEDLDKGIRLSQKAHLMCMTDQTPHMVVNGYAAALYQRYLAQGKWDDCDRAISLLRAEAGSRQAAPLMGCLGQALLSRYAQTNSKFDLEDAIKTFREVLERLPLKDPTRPSILDSLGTALYIQYMAYGLSRDLEDAISLSQGALDLQPRGELHPRILINLATAIALRYYARGDEADLDEVVTHLQTALQLSQTGPIGRFHRLKAYTILLSPAFRSSTATADLEDAVKLYSEHAQAIPPGHLDRSVTLQQFARALHAWIVGQDPSQIRDVPLYLSRKHQLLSTLWESTVASGGPIERLDASLSLIHATRTFDRETSLQAYVVALQNLDTALMHSHSLEERSVQMFSVLSSRVKGLVVEAASMAISHGKLELAVELLEQGRSVILNQIGRNRTPIDEVRRVNPELADHFVRLSRQLDESLARTDGPVLPGTRFEDAISRYHKASTEWTALVEEIRLIDGFGSFLRPTPFKELQGACLEGPVIIVNVSKYRTDAIIIQADNPPTFIPLPNATEPVLTAISKQLATLGPGARDMDVIDILRLLWGYVVEPVARKLRQAPRLPLGSRIWWCPTGIASTLPLHAAGSYARGVRDLPHLFVSSYTPTLQSLRRARNGERPTASMPNMLIVAQADTPGEKALPHVEAEVESILKYVPQAVVLKGTDGTREAMLSELPQHKWAHIACHGHRPPVSDQPFEAAFSLYDGGLELLNIVKVGLPNAELAVLSACHSARVDVETADEVLHLAAGMHFAGFRSVVGTMWALGDQVGPVFATEFYRRMVSDDGRAKDCTAAARTLNQVFTSLGRQGVPLVQRMNFVHFGI